MHGSQLFLNSKLGIGGPSGAGVRSIDDLSGAARGFCWEALSCTAAANIIQVVGLRVLVWRMVLANFQNHWLMRVQSIGSHKNSIKLCANTALRFDQKPCRKAVPFALCKATVVFRCFRETLTTYFVSDVWALYILTY